MYSLCGCCVHCRVCRHEELSKRKRNKSADPQRNLPLLSQRTESSSLKVKMVLICITFRQRSLHAQRFSRTEKKWLRKPSEVMTSSVKSGPSWRTSSGIQSRRPMSTPQNISKFRTWILSQPQNTYAPNQIQNPRNMIELKHTKLILTFERIILNIGNTNEKSQTCVWS